ncbi:hypothetical protein Desaci_3200 [Desulfosporosinus acidiphilus SJ4]|uniref:Uncharacterized protein n=1 Tax=Desulfosporosinus acidiphilus (strain DSM 22704 / JCM 16185 / SJ4) TaxID=646529 RepID=I4D8H7_DESAJ|nr:hypothetical protein [Desulfosporosinus acidiphilus]AFM42101.1 hypothetical protein Desaci_3200 [Desulfosporosinus acidiphilus SJ4]
MNKAFWRYMLLLSLLFLFWSEFFVSGGILSQLAFNFALFYPLGFFVGYRSRQENIRTAYLAGFIFNLLSYLASFIYQIPIQSWSMVILDFVSFFIFVKLGAIFGKRAQS